MAKKKRTKKLGRGEIVTFYNQVDIYPGAIIISDMEDAVEIIEMMEAAVEAAKPILDFITRAREATTDWQVTTGTPVVQGDGFYWRKIERDSPYWDTDELEEFAKALTVKEKGKQLWSLITKRTLNPTLIEKAVAKGWVKEKDISKFYKSSPQKPFIQRYSGEAKDGE
jgi:hypothetical protein